MRWFNLHCRREALPVWCHRMRPQILSLRPAETTPAQTYRYYLAWVTKHCFTQVGNHVFIRQTIANLLHCQNWGEGVSECQQQSANQRGKPTCYFLVGCYTSTYKYGNVCAAPLVTLGKPSAVWKGIFWYFSDSWALICVNRFVLKLQ